MEAMVKSILVPSVQDLANKGSTVEVPDRYIRLDQHPPISDHIHDHHHDDHIPIIDMEALVNGDHTQLMRLHSACQQWGFFQLINHGVNYSLVEKFKLETKEFFMLPSHEKKKYWQTPNDVEGFGQSFVVSDEQKLDWSDIFYLTTLPKHQRRSHLLPMLPLPYRYTLEHYSGQLFELARKVLDFLAKALEVDNEAMRGAFGEGSQSIRMNYYPPCLEPNKVIGLTPHSDSVGLTILLQLNEIEGLQIWKDGNWVSVKPVSDDAFIINVGDILEIVSNGIYRSILHRAIVNENHERLSVAAFYGPSMETEVRPIHSLVTPQTPAKFRSISMVDFTKGLFSRALDGKAYLDHMKINVKN